MNTFKVFRVRPSAWSACGCVMEVRDASASCFCNSGSLALLLTVPMMATRCVPVVHLKLVIVVLRGKLFFLQLVWKLLSHWIDFCFKTCTNLHKQTAYSCPSLSLPKRNSTFESLLPPTRQHYCPHRRFYTFTSFFH